MTEALPPAILDFYAQLPQQGPGSDRDSEAALLPIIDKLPSEPAIADFGSGTGRSALFLAARLETRVIAVEIAAPFCRRMAERAQARGLANLVDIRQGDMADPPVEPASLDLIWSEGAAYIIGFATALKCWRPLLGPGAFCVVSECSWLSDERPPAVERVFAAGYPGMTTIAGNVERAEQQGYEVLATHVVSAEGWERYYAPVRQALSEEGDCLDPAFAAELREEMALYEQSGGSYGYMFYVLQKSD